MRSNPGLGLVNFALVSAYFRTRLWGITTRCSGC